MKVLKYSILVCVAFAYSNFGFSQVISFDKLVHDYGIIPENAGKVESVFTFTNIGDKPLVLRQVKPGCGCTTSDYTKDSVAPGGKGYIRILFNPQGYSSLFSKYVKVQSNSIDGLEIVLIIKGTVKKQDLLKEEQYPYVMEYIRMKTPSLDFGTIKFTEVKTDTVYLYNPQDTSVTIMFPSLPPFIKADILPQNVMQPNAEAIIVISYDPVKRNDWGAVFDKVYIGYEGRKNTYKSRINISGVIQEDFSKLTKKELKNAPHIEFNSLEFNFDTIQQGEIVTTVYPFKNTGKSPLSIRKIKTSCGCTAGQLDKNEFAKGEQGEIKVTFNSGHKQNNINQTITVVTNDPNKPLRELTIRGYVIVPEIKK